MKTCQAADCSNITYLNGGRDRFCSARCYFRDRALRLRLRSYAASLSRRDGDYCGICGRPLDYRTDEFHIDHIVPHSKGGSHDMANLQLAHPSCNLRKSNRMPEPINAEQATFDFPLQLELPPCASS